MCKNGWPARLMWLTRYILAWHARGSQIESHSCQRWFWGSFIRRKRQNSAGNVAFTVALKPMGRAIWGSKQSVPVAPQNGDSYPKRRKTLYKRNGWPLKALVKKICTILSSVPSWLHWNLQASISFGFAQIKWCLVTSAVHTQNSLVYQYMANIQTALFGGQPCTLADHKNYTWVSLLQCMI